MSFRFENRSYSGQTFRPRPEIHLDPVAKLLIVATPWGPRAAARKAIERMVEYISLSRDDREATSPFQRLSCLTSHANSLRIATLLANDALFREDNRHEYKSGVEIFGGMLEDHDFVFVYAGNPQVLLDRAGRHLLPLGSHIDFAFDLSETSSIYPALPSPPSQVLGLDSTVNLTINSFRVQAADRVVLLSHSYLPPSLFTLKPGDTSVDTITKTLANNHPDLAFWLGVLDIDEPIGRSADSTAPWPPAEAGSENAGDTDGLASTILENI